MNRNCWFALVVAFGAATSIAVLAIPPGWFKPSDSDTDMNATTQLPDITTETPTTMPSSTSSSEPSSSSSAAAPTTKAPYLPIQRPPLAYSINVKTYADSNGDGIGDLAGVTEMLNFLAGRVGVSHVILSPIHPSGGQDSMYDVIDHMAVDANCGTEAALSELCARAGMSNTKIIMTAPLAWCSTTSEIFKLSENRTEGYETAIYWSASDATNDAGQWGWSSLRHQYYLHAATPQQAYLNFSNQLVHDKHLRPYVSKWAALGVDGFYMHNIYAAWVAACAAAGYTACLQALTSGQEGEPSYVALPSDVLDAQDSFYKSVMEEGMRQGSNFILIADDASGAGLKSGDVMRAGAGWNPYLVYPPPRLFPDSKNYDMTAEGMAKRIQLAMTGYAATAGNPVMYVSSGNHDTLRPAALGGLRLSALLLSLQGAVTNRGMPCLIAGDEVAAVPALHPDQGVRIERDRRDFAYPRDAISLTHQNIGNCGWGMVVPKKAACPIAWSEFDTTFAHFQRARDAVLLVGKGGGTSSLDDDAEVVEPLKGAPLVRLRRGGCIELIFAPGGGDAVLANDNTPSVYISGSARFGHDENATLFRQYDFVMRRVC